MEYRGGILVANSDLYHHGILGQKWGKRNGPPYPLNASAHSSAENKAGWKKSLKSNGSSNGNVKKGIKKIFNSKVARKAAWASNQGPEFEFVKKQINKKNIEGNEKNREKAKQQREFNKKPLEERQKIWKEEQSKYFKENKEKLLKNAKEKDMYDLEFLERTPDEWSKKPLKERLKDYEKYIDSNIIKTNEEASGSLFSKKKKKNPDAKAIAQERLKTLQTQNPSLYEAKKQTALQKGNSTEVLQFKGNLTNQQLQDAVSRIRLEKQLSEWSASDVKSNWDKVDDAMKRVKQVTDWTNTTLNAYDAAEKVYKKLSNTK